MIIFLLRLSDFVDTQNSSILRSIPIPLSIYYQFIGKIWNYIYVYIIEEQYTREFILQNR